ncbi:MAG: hypothetical protein Q9191_001038 [Dirinaria sp. TL-2023a]
MPKAKQPLNATKKRGKIDMGVEHEEAGEKWRAGDAEKSSRFFAKAIADYDAGLQAFPRSFDLAYNRWRQDHHPQVIRLLQEALELFQRCLSLQEFQFTRIGEQDDNSAAYHDRLSDGTSPKETLTESSPIEDEEWAFVDEPVTRDTLIDTILAQLETLTTICSLDSFEAGDNLGWIEEYYSNMLKDKIELLTAKTVRVQEASLAKAKFVAAFADLSFHHGQLDMLEYERELVAAFGPVLDLSKSARGLCDRADTAIVFQASIGAPEATAQMMATDMTRLNGIRWKHLTSAIEDLTAASKLPDAENVPRIHLRRGDCELLRYCLGKGPNPYEPAVKSLRTLIMNAGVYYRGASGLARNAVAGAEMREASIKEAIVASLSSNRENWQLYSKAQHEAVLEVLEDMKEESLLTDEDIASL